MAGFRTATILAMAALTMMAGPSAATEHPVGRNAVTLFGAQLTDNKWKEIATLDDVSMRGAYLAGLGLSRELSGGRDWALEIEGQVARHFGDQGLWEFNGVLIGRWRGFPWNDSVPTSIALGAGPSYTTEVPPGELAMNSTSARFLIYWMAELEIGFPESAWSAITRLHHRSSGYGLMAEDGGSNWLTIGLRRRF